MKCLAALIDGEVYNVYSFFNFEDFNGGGGG
jgi:hypothetical protein